ncbi:MAG: tRNA lysidine(34) synthetase TilS [Betaproteobacteria bacterium HGW-Betaproteobacteria-3]|jgi:tRNA(Ile)-lysidine synthase|nr:MAG: tRNA lysidine(34) synthetase TilS [Betaproteobacteria bacterium HGW-Betaproteobacteria-3]
MRQTFDAAIEAFTPGLPLAVALSGGADSTALLLACAAKWPGQVRAIHVHHGLQPAADAFAQHCTALCAALGVPLAVRHVDARHATGQSPEDAARHARLEAFEAVALAEWSDVAIKDIAIAQHADDQAETVLLALSRGAGLPGLAAMPGKRVQGGLTLHRPLLRVRGADLRTWLTARQATWVEDPTNTDARYTRNRIRAHVLPTLDAAFPQFRETFARSAAHAAQAQALLAEVAAADLMAVGTPPTLKALQALSRARQANVLRHWLRSACQTTPSAAQLDELLDQIAACTTRGHGIRIKVGAGSVVREGDRIQYLPSL